MIITSQKTGNSAKSKDYKNFHELYDVIYAYRKNDIVFYVNITEKLKSKRVLEIGGGTGRISIPIVEYNSNCKLLWSLDIDHLPIEVLRQRIKEKKIENIFPFHGYIEDIPNGEYFDLVIAPFRVFHLYQSIESLKIEFLNIYKLLENGGYFVFDLFDPNEDLLSQGVRLARTYRDKEKNSISRAVFYKEFSSDCRLAFVKEECSIDYADGRKGYVEQEYYQSWFFEREVKKALIDIGFLDIEVFGDFNESPVGTHEFGELVFVCKK